MHRIEQALHQVHSRIEKAIKNSVEPSQAVSLMAVSKKHTVDNIVQAYRAGQRDFGENYLQEAVEKQQILSDLDIVWHFIGPVQSNKTRDIARSFAWVHSVDRFKIAKRLSEQRPDNLPPLNICLQINIDEEQSKAGIAQSDAVRVTEDLIQLPKLKLRGLMVIPRPTDDQRALRDAFRRTRLLKQKIEQTLDVGLDTLSMGMSSDLDLAIAEGATIVRVGSSIFGERAIH